MQSVIAASTPGGYKAPPTIAIHAPTESDFTSTYALNPQHYHPHNVDRREKRKQERIAKLQAIVKQKNTELKHLKKALHKQEQEADKLKDKVIVMTEELCCVKQALTEALSEVTVLKKQHATALRQLEKLRRSHDSTVTDFMASEMVIERLEEEKVELKQVLSEFQVLNKI